MHEAQLQVREPPDTSAGNMCCTASALSHANKRYLTDQEQRKALQHLAPALLNAYACLH